METHICKTLCVCARARMLCTYRTTLVCLNPLVSAVSKPNLLVSAYLFICLFSLLYFSSQLQLRRRNVGHLKVSRHTQHTRQLTKTILKLKTPRATVINFSHFCAVVKIHKLSCRGHSCPSHCLVAVQRSTYFTVWKLSTGNVSSH